MLIDAYSFLLEMFLLQFQKVNLCFPTAVEMFEWVKLIQSNYLYTLFEPSLKANSQPTKIQQNALWIIYKTNHNFTNQ